MGLSRRSSYFLVILGLFGGVFGVNTNTTVTKSENNTLSISLAKYNTTNGNGQTFYTRTNLSMNSDSYIDVINIPSNVAFIIIQVHTHENNVTLSYDDPLPHEGINVSVSGSNVGLEMYIDKNGSQSARFSVSNNNSIALDVLIAVVAYTDKAPIPGGCNVEFDIKVSPFQKVLVTEATVTIDAQAASMPKITGKPMRSCDTYSVKLEAYRLYLPERDFSIKTYFDGILKMMTVQDIIANGKKILPAMSASSFRRVYSAYPGTGSVYAMIATYENYSSAYVPATSYACSPISDPSSCNHLNTATGQAVCAIVLILGFLLVFIGHKCLGFEVMILGALFGGVIGYSCLFAIGHMQTSTALGIAIGISCLNAIGWLILSLYMGMKCVVTFLSSMTLGFFIASTVYFGITDILAGEDKEKEEKVHNNYLKETKDKHDTLLFESDVNFWLIYTGVTFLVAVVLAVVSFNSNAVLCAILGAYSIILPIDYYVGSNLKYIVINTIRRATIPGFNVAVIQPPYQSTDKWLVAFLIIIALIAIYVQAKCCKCAMCCAKTNRTTVYWTDQQPILSASRRGRRVLVFGENNRVETNPWYS